MYCMPLLRFHICAKEVFIADSSGTEVDDLAAAHEYALKIIHDSMFFVSREPIWRGWMVKIAEEGGHTVLTVLYPNRLWTDRHSSEIASEKRFDRRDHIVRQ